MKATKLLRRLREWMVVLTMALPLVAADIVADQTTGWISVAARLFVWAATLSLIVLAISHGLWAWRRLLDDDESSEDVC
jgi:hypothetical protein